MAESDAISDYDYQQYANRPQDTWGWASSVTFHVLMFLLISFLLYQVPKGIGEETVQTGGIVLVNADLAANEKPYLEQSDIQSPETAEHAAAAAMGGEVTEQTPALDVNDLPELPGMQSSEDARKRAQKAQQEGSGISDLALPNAQVGGGKIGQEAVRFGGMVGTGSRFVYVVDRSGSMNNSGLMQAAKAELEASINSLTEHQQFQLIFYNDEALIFNPTGAAPKLMHATKDNIALVMEFIRQTPASGGTVHIKALEPALKLTPDVIFMLTDADDLLSEADNTKLARWNKSNASINVLVFGPTPEPTAVNLSFSKLAKETRGQFVFKSTVALRKK
ncbi:MAG: VWA domain-containing protein [Pirellulaceae bacterium]|nr:VWA domain-containing protein [Pirellulaceae bacterium]